MTSDTNTLKTFIRNPIGFLTGMIVGIALSIGLLEISDWDITTKGTYFTTKEVSRNYVPKEDFRELQKKHKDLQNLQSQLVHSKTNTGKLKTELEICHEKNNVLSKSLQQANNRIKKLNDVEKLKVEKDNLWGGYHSVDTSNWNNNLSPNEKSEKKEGIKNQIDQLQREIELRLKCQ
jgi:predicted  nucleic acid-binding Zn-ribbon protein